MKPNYRDYNFTELQDALEHLDVDEFPERHKEIVRQIEKRRKLGLDTVEDDRQGFFSSLDKKFKNNDIMLYVVGLLSFLIMLTIEFL